MSVSRYDYYYNKELHKALEDLKEAERAYEPVGKSRYLIHAHIDVQFRV